MSKTCARDDCEEPIAETSRLGAVDEQYGEIHITAVGRYRWTCEAGHSGTEDVVDAF